MAGNPTKLPFDKAIAYFRKKLNVPADRGDTIQGEENDWAFAVSGVVSAEMLADFRAACDRFVAQSADFDRFTKEFSSISERYGWQPPKGQSVAWRAALVGQANLRMAYSAGQWEQRQDPTVRALRPGLMWRWRDSPHPRLHHKALDGRIFDSEQYGNLSAPSGFGCKCRLYSVPKPDKGYDELSDRLPYKLPDGKLTQIPAVRVEKKLYPIADPGFYYVPGQSPLSNRPALLQQMIERQPPALQKLIRKAIPQRLLQAMKPKGFGKD